MMKNISCLFLLLTFVSCSRLNFSTPKDSVKKWELIDQGEHYSFRRQTRHKKKKYLNIQSITTKGNSKKQIEKLKVVSEIGILKNKLQILRPEYSFLEVWIDKQKHITKMTLNKKTKSFDVVVQNEIGVREFSQPFPSEEGVFCFYSQIVDCLRVTGFFDKVKKHNAGAAKVNVIWEGAFLYYSLYEFYPQELFTPAEFIFDGEDEKSLLKFSLKFKDQSIYYLLDQQYYFHSLFWITQNMSIVPATNKKKTRGNL